MKEIIGNLFGFLYTLSMGDYLFLSLTFILILLFIYMLFLIRKEEVSNETENLENIVKTLEKEYKPTTVNLTEYEEEQEKNAIISYEELLNNKDKLNINYDEEYVSNIDEICVKKISLNETKVKEEPAKINVKLMSYENEEAFLIALKQLQQNLLN